MKKIILSTLGLLLSFAAVAKPVSIETARTVAENFWKNKTSDSKVSFVEVSHYFNLEYMYVFNTSDNSGFVIVSADDAALPILGYSCSNGFMGSLDMGDNVRGWLEHYSEEIGVLKATGASADAATAKKWQDLLNGVAPKKGNGAKAVAPFITTQWDQGDPYNRLCPYDNGYNRKAVTGCVATSVSQVMKYWNWPIKGTGSKSYNCQNVSGQISERFDTIYQWDLMPEGGNITPVRNWTLEQKKAVALLLYHVGVSVNMSYGYASSGALPTNIAPALSRNFFYANDMQSPYKEQYSDAVWKNMIITDIDARRPVVYGGAKNTAGEDGHSFVCDGYDTDTNFHFNFGWSGDKDGYFVLSSINPGSGGIGSTSYDFTYNQHAVFGIKPGLQTTRSFTISESTVVGSRATGSCTFRNACLSAFVGYLGIAAYSTNGEFLTIMTKTASISLGANATKALSINYKTDAPDALVPGNYIAKAVVSIDGENWRPLEIGYNDCPVEVPFSITSSQGINHVSYTAPAVKIYPNPTNSTFTVESEGLQKVEVIDALGRVVICQNHGSVDMSALNNGVYSVRVTANGCTAVKKIAKQ